MYSPDGTNVYGSRGGQFDGIGKVHGLESCKIVFLGGTSYSPVQILLYHLATGHFVTDRQMDRQTTAS